MKNNAIEPLKIWVVFDEHDSAVEAESLISHVAANYESEVRHVQFDELDETFVREELARGASEADMLVVALRDGSLLPSQVKSWLGLCLDIRADGQEGVLVALVAHPWENLPQDSSAAEYLELLAMAGGLEFFGNRGQQKSLPASRHQLLEARI